MSKLTHHREEPTLKRNTWLLYSPLWSPSHPEAISGEEEIHTTENSAPASVRASPCPSEGLGNWCSKLASGQEPLYMRRSLVNISSPMHRSRAWGCGPIIPREELAFVGKWERKAQTHGPCLPQYLATQQLKMSRGQLIGCDCLNSWCRYLIP